MQLPVDEVLPELIEAVRRDGGAVLVAPTGAGKTTRVPLALLRADLGPVLVLEPRRVAARAAARFMAAQLNEPVGRTVGWHVRFDRRASEHTRVLVVTEGLLVRRLHADPFLDGVRTVILDEVHERHLATDMALAMLRRVREEVRPDLRLVLMSATLDAEWIADQLGLPVVRSQGRAHPVTIEHRDVSPTPESVAAEVRASLGDGDVLAFLPGVGEIHRTATALAGVPAEVLPLHGRLRGAEQDRALRPAAGRRVVLATNVAESSVTVQGVVVVVDSGLERQLRHDLGRGLDRLDVVPVGRDAAEQRAGRAGREGPGRCVRLWSEATHARRPQRHPPELLRVELSATVLQLLAWGESDPLALPWLEPPPPAAVASALDLLHDLGATADGRVTPLGRRMAGLPVHPRLAATLLAAHSAGDLRAGARIAAWLSESRAALAPGRPTSTSDVLDAIEHLEPPIAELAHHLERLARAQLGRDPPGDHDLRRAVLAGFPDRVATRREGAARLVMAGRRGAALDPASAVRTAPWLVAVDVIGASPDAKVRVASSIEPSWLPSERVDHLAFEESTGRVDASTRRVYRDLVIEERTAEDADPDAVSACLAEAARTRLDRALPLADPAVTTLRARITCLATWRPELDLPSVQDDDLRDRLPELCAGRRSLRDLQRLDLAAAIEAWLTWEQRRQLDLLAPERLPVPSGSHIRLTWEPDTPPVLAVRMQELFGSTHTPTVNGGRTRVRLHLLAPNYRPVQITDELAGFWERTWPEVRKELRARYPRHPWPVDPANATPIRK